MTPATHPLISPEQRERICLKIHGTVQGMGFRPFVFRLAESLSLGGWIANTSQGTLIELEGDPLHLQEFQMRVMTELPPSGNVQGIASTSIPVIGEQSFSIRPSQENNNLQSVLSPDLSTCSDCLEDINNQKSRRYRYPLYHLCPMRTSVQHRPPSAL